MAIFTLLTISYLMAVFVLPRIIIPHLGFVENNIPNNISPDIMKKIDEIKDSSKDKKDFLKKTYEFLGGKYKTGRISVLFRLTRLFWNIDRVWDFNGLVPCTKSSFLMNIFLVKSGFFKEDEVRRRHTMLFLNIHQFLQVKIDEKWIDVDTGEYQRGVPIGKHKFLFG